MNRGKGNLDYYLKHYVDRDIKDYEWLWNDVKPFYNGGKVLDLGCGIGLFLKYLKTQNIDCIGIEGSEYVRSLVKNSEINIIIQDLKEKLPFNDGEISVVVLNQVIEHLESDTQLKLINEVFRVLKKGGVFFIYAPSCYNLKEKFADKTHINMPSPWMLKRKLKAAGFTIVLNKNIESINLSFIHIKLHFLVKRITRFFKIIILPQTSNFISIK
jgi:SAM-dependent methyltransferase